MNAPDRMGGLAERVGPRADRRPSPRLGVVLATTGALLAVSGVLQLGGDELGGGGGSDPNQFPGIVLTLGAVVGGYVLLTVVRGVGPLAAAGTTMVVVATPSFWFFATFDDDSFELFNPDVVLLMSTLVWVASYLVGPGRGHPLFLAGALAGAWLWVLEVVEGLVSFPFDFAISGFGVFTGEGSGLLDSAGEEPPDVTTLGVLSLAFALLYLVTARVLDGRGRAGIATPLTGTGIVALITAISLLAGELEAEGTGIMAIVAGLAVAWYGAATERRGSNWIGGAGVLIGLSILIGEWAGEGDALGLTLIGVGGLVVVGAHALAAGLGEPPETVPGPSRFTPAPATPASPPAEPGTDDDQPNGGSTQPSGPPPPPAGSSLG